MWFRWFTTSSILKQGEHNNISRCRNKPHHPCNAETRHLQVLNHSVWHGRQLSWVATEHRHCWGRGHVVQVIWDIVWSIKNASIWKTLHDDGNQFQLSTTLGQDPVSSSPPITKKLHFLPHYNRSFNRCVFMDTLLKAQFSSRSRSSTQSHRGPTARSSSSSPYPFHPDRLDPASPPNSAESYDNSVNWYYSSYNNENTDPYVGPRHERTSGVAPNLSHAASVFMPIILLLFVV